MLCRFIVCLLLIEFNLQQFALPLLIFDFFLFTFDVSYPVSFLLTRIEIHFPWLLIEILHVLLILLLLLFNQIQFLFLTVPLAFDQVFNIIHLFKFGLYLFWNQFFLLIEFVYLFEVLLNLLKLFNFPLNLRNFAAYLITKVLFA